MSLADNYRILKYVSDGKQVEFPVLWRFFDPDTVLVKIYSKDGILVNNLSYGRDYSVVATGEDTGRVTLSTPAESGLIVAIYRLEPYVQLLEMLNSGKFDLVKLEECLDHIVMLTQQNRDELLRCLQVPPGSEMTPEEFVNDLLKKYGEILDAWQKISIAIQNLFSQTIVPFTTRDGVLEYEVGEDIILDPDANNLLLSLGGVVQEPEQAYTIVDKNHIRFTANPGAGLRCWGISCLSFSNPDIRAIVQKAIEKIWAEANKIIATDAFVVPGTTEPRNLLQRFGDIINVKDFGAKGDGLADESDSIQAALNFAQDQVNTQYGRGRPIVWFPCGVYRIGKPLRVEKGVVYLQGDGWWQTTLVSTAPDGDMFYFSVQNVRIKGMQFQGAGIGKTENLLHFAVLPTTTLDTDAWIDGCWFGGANVGVNYSGRNLVLFDCTFGLLNSGVLFDCPDDYKQNDFELGNLPFGFRTHHIRGCRVEGVGTFIRNSGKNADKCYGILAEDLHCVGINGAVFYGVAKYCTFSNIQVIGHVGQSSANTSFVMFSGSHDYTISNFIEKGMKAAPGSASGIKTTYFGYYAATFIGNQSNFSLSNCILDGFTGKTAIRFVEDSAASGADFTVQNGTLQNIKISNVGMSETPATASGSGILFGSNAVLKNMTLADISFVEQNDPDRNFPYFAKGATISVGSSANASKHTNLSLSRIINAWGFSYYLGVDASREYDISSGVALQRADASYSIKSKGFRSVANVLDASNAPVAALEHYMAEDETKRHSMRWAQEGPYFTFDIARAPDAATGASVMPGTDNKIYLGNATFRFAQLFAASTTIATSDERSKGNIAPIDDAVLDAWGAVEFRQFVFNDAVDKKGAVSARLHSGVIAQQVVKAFSDNGLDAAKYGLLCFDRWEDEYEEVQVVDVPAVIDSDGNEVVPAKSHTERKLAIPAGDRYGIRYSEALCMEAAYQRRRADALEQRIAALENAMANTNNISEDNTGTTYLPTKTI